jgi:CheY-like chemotaxis protein
MSETPTATPVEAPTVYFIDDSATMREVIKIAFRKENIHVITCPSVTAAIEQFGAVRPDAVISDVIMPDRDGYELCSYVKGHAELGKTPVILMSGVVNRTVAEKATVVRADELLRKPFQPQELVARVKKLLRGESPEESRAGQAAPKESEGNAPSALSGLSGLFSPAAPPKGATAAPPPAPREAAPAAIPAAPAAEMHRPPAAAQPAAPAAPAAPNARPAAAPAALAAASPAAPASAALPSDAQRVRLEIQRLELLVKKLQSELEAERQYCQALEAHIRALQGCV